MNEGLFVYAFFANYYLRNDPYSSVLPGLYDVIPARYIDLGYIVDAWKATLEGKTFNRKHPYVIYVNYSSCSYTPREDWVLSYYTQDVIRLAFQDINHLCNPFWARWKDYHINRTRRGDDFYFYVKYVVNRYNLERLSNNITDVEPIDYVERVCGVDVNKRLVRYIRTLERRLEDAIDSGFVVDCEWKKYSLLDARSSDIFGNIVQGNEDSINTKYYGSIIRALLRYAEEIIDSCQKYTVGDSILNRPQSVLRSPLYFEVYARVAQILDHYKYHLGPYSRKQLWLPGVKVENLVVDDMITFFESWDFELNNAIPVKNTEEASQLMVLARTKRINHKPFSYRITVYSEKPKEVRIRFFLGPRYDKYGVELSLNERRLRMLYIDSYVCKLEKGKNDLVRNSKNFDFFEKVPLSYDKLWWLTESALAGKTKPYIDSFVIRDDHLLLPKGTECGLPVVAYVMVSAYDPKEDSWINPDNRISFFPFDRPIVNEWEFSVPNARSCVATIYHRDITKKVAKD